MLLNFEETVYRKLNSEEKYDKATSKYQRLRWIFESWKETTDELMTKVYFLISKNAHLLGFEIYGFFSGEEGREKVFQRNSL